jgi:type VI secretion system protein ImpC
MAGRITLELPLRAASGRERVRPDAQSPMRILVLGDFSARAHRGTHAHPDLAHRKPAWIDVDNFDRVMGRIAPRLELGVEGDRVALELAALDDFHPDLLYRRVPSFQELREIRSRMQVRATFDDAAARFRSLTRRRIEPSSPQSGVRGEEADADTLERLLGSAPRVAGPASGTDARVQALIHSAVAPHVVPSAPAHQSLYIEALDAEIASRMRAILQAPQFKALEALWRGVHWLASNLETGGDLRLYVLDVTRAEALSDLRAAQADARSSALYRLLAGEEPWSLILSDEAFGLAEDDIELLGGLGLLASRVGAPVLAAAKPELAAGDSPEPWNALRESALAPWIGLALPRVLLRLPYGKRSDPVEAFPFEELGSGPRHAAYLWGNGALACALLIGRSFSARGWDMEPGDELEIDDLPAHTYEEEGEKRLQPCAEIALTDRTGEAVLEAGLMPLLGFKSRNAVRLMRFQSIGKPAQALAGPWAAA